MTAFVHLLYITGAKHSIIKNTKSADFYDGKSPRLVK